MRWSAGTKSAPPCVVTRATKLVIDCFVGPSFQDGSGSPEVCAEADMERSGPNRTGSAAKVETSRRRLRPPVPESCFIIISI